MTVGSAERRRSSGEQPMPRPIVSDAYTCRPIYLVRSPSFSGKGDDDHSDDDLADALEWSGQAVRFADGPSTKLDPLDLFEKRIGQLMDHVLREGTDTFD